MTIKAITFDFWRTLYLDNHGGKRHNIRVEAFRRTTGKSVTEIEDAAHMVFREFDRVHREEQRTLGPRDKVRMMLEHLGVVLPEDTSEELAEISATAILHHPPDPIDLAPEAVRAAAERFPIGLISDAAVSPGRCLRKVLERDGLLDLFRVVTFSDEVGVAKPQAPMFFVTAEAIGVRPDEILHIGDLEYTDIRGIQELGGKAALFAGYNDEFLHSTRADFVFRNWGEFLHLLPQLAEV